LIKKRGAKIGLPPGSLVYSGELKPDKATITVTQYSESQFQQKVTANVEDALALCCEQAVTWINVDGIQDIDVLEKIGNHFGLHPLVLEDILNTDHRPKIDDYGDYLYIVLKMLDYNSSSEEVVTDQVSLILGSNFLLSFHEKRSDFFNPLIERINNGKTKIRKMGADYLAYSLIDLIVDNYFVVLEKFSERIEDKEEELISNPSNKTLQYIHSLKREILILRKSIWPLREVISGLERIESALITDSTAIYFRDVYDHIIQIVDTTETLRDVISEMLDIYLSSVSNRMNAVMKVLTIIATIFIPLTFIVGIYGMNFRYMPELEWHWGYFTVWGVIVVIVIVMIILFKKKRWI